MKIIEYSVEHIDDVQGSIDHGYQPWGSPFIRSTANGEIVCQAVVKYEEEKAIFNPPYPIIEPGKVYEEYHSEATIRDEVDRRARDYQKYWNTGTNMYEIFKGERGEWICTQQELLAYIEKSVRWEMGK